MPDTPYRSHRFPRFPPVERRLLLAILMGVLPILLIGAVALTLLEQENSYGIAVVNRAAALVHHGYGACAKEGAGVVQGLRHGAQLMEAAAAKGRLVLLVFTGLSVLLAVLLGVVVARGIEAELQRPRLGVGRRAPPGGGQRPDGGQG